MAVTHDRSLSGSVSRGADTRPTLSADISQKYCMASPPTSQVILLAHVGRRFSLEANNVGRQNDDRHCRPTTTVTTIHHLQETVTLNKPSTIQLQLNHTTVQRCACLSGEHKFCQLLITNYTAPLC